MGNAQARRQVPVQWMLQRPDVESHLFAGFAARSMAPPHVLKQQLLDAALAKEVLGGAGRGSAALAAEALNESCATEDSSTLDLLMRIHCTAYAIAANYDDMHCVLRP